MSALTSENWVLTSGDWVLTSRNKVPTLNRVLEINWVLLFLKWVLTMHGVLTSPNKVSTLNWGFAMKWVLFWRWVDCWYQSVIRSVRRSDASTRFRCSVRPLSFPSVFYTAQNRLQSPARVSQCCPCHMSFANKHKRARWQILWGPRRRRDATLSRPFFSFCPSCLCAQTCINMCLSAFKMESFYMFVDTREKQFQVPTCHNHLRTDVMKVQQVELLHTHTHKSCTPFRHTDTGWVLHARTHAHALAHRPKLSTTHTHASAALDTHARAHARSKICTACYSWNVSLDIGSLREDAPAEKWKKMVRWVSTPSPSLVQIFSKNKLDLALSSPTLKYRVPHYIFFPSGEWLLRHPVFLGSAPKVPRLFITQIGRSYV